MIAAAFLHILQRVFALSALGINYYHNLKTSSPKRWMMSDLILAGRLSHLQKALFPIFVTLSGIFILVSDLHHEKALSSTFVTLLGILILVSESHPEKALSSMFVTLFGILMLVSDLHPEKA